MFNCRFHLAKQPFRQAVAAGGAFWRIARGWVGSRWPESLQRAKARLRAGSGRVGFERVLASCGAFFAVGVAVTPPYAPSITTHAHR